MDDILQYIDNHRARPTYIQKIHVEFYFILYESGNAKSMHTLAHDKRKCNRNCNCNSRTNLIAFQHWRWRKLFKLLGCLPTIVYPSALFSMLNFFTELNFTIPFPILQNFNKIDTIATWNLFFFLTDWWKWMYTILMQKWLKIFYHKC